MADRASKVLACLGAVMVLGPMAWSGLRPWLEAAGKEQGAVPLDLAEPSLSASVDLPEGEQADPPAAALGGASPAWQELIGRTAAQNPKPQVTPAAVPMPAADRELMQLIQAKFHVGDYHSALQLAEQHTGDHSRSPAFTAWLTAQLPVLLVSSGWLAIKTGHCEQAIERLTRAVEQQRSPEAASGLAFCYFKTQQWAKAEGEMAWYLTQERGRREPQAWLLYSEIQESLLNYQKAGQALEQALALGDPAQKEIFKKRLAAMRYKDKQSEDQQLAESRYFSLSFPALAQPEFGEQVLALLEESLVEFVEGYRARVGGARKFEVLLYPSEGFGQVVAGAPHWASGIYDGRIRIPVGGWENSQEQWRRLRFTLRHEMVHAVLAEMVDRRRLPSWFDEGVADHFAHGSQLAHGFGFPTVRGRFLSAEDFAEPFTKLDKIRAEQAYRQSLYLVLQLERRVERSALGQMIEGLTPQLPLDSASLLAPLQLNFPRLVEQARDGWQRGDPLNW